MADPQVLADIDNIKIPYPTEGVIRTAQLDDTVSPPNSAQLAVNMNFDRVGATMTRLGVQTYADVLTDAINNFGTLHNEVVPAGYANLTQLGTIEDLQTTMKFPSAVKVSDTKIALFWTDENNHGFAQNLSINEVTGDIVPLGTPLEFESTFNSGNKAIFVSANLVMNTWTTSGNNGYAQTFDTSLDQIAADLSPFDFNSALSSNFNLAQIDSSHFLLFYTSGTSSDAVAVVLAVNLSNGAVSQPGSPTTVQAGPSGSPSLTSLGDGIHFMCVWSSTTGVNAQTLAVNLSTWAITALSTPLVFGTSAQNQNALSCLDGQHFVNIYRNSAGIVAAQAFNVNLSTFAITTVGTPVTITGSFGNDITATYLDGFHFLVTYSMALGTGFVQLITCDSSTFNMSLTGTPLTSYDFANTGYTTAINLTPTIALVGWGNVNALDGQAVMFETFGTVVESRWLYAGSGNEIYNTKTTSAGVWTPQRTGLATVSKPRFAQFLNYIWMVNGNGQIGGDPVATSNGGAFGTDLVPVNLPAGDYIHAGFEGRVWIADASLGIIYYTDIVQFTPPNVYTLTYNQQVNFITTIAPQTGETFTGFCEVPRALLVFTQNTITRIYGAASIDAYPAYNVGTYSQESIIANVKNGIYFHHSSGFYQFTPNVYAAQPTEISRRIIDFVKAIPRSNYENITGVYDGFDNVEWSIGQVTVEGVVYQNCMCRFTISTQVWTIYDYVGSSITALIFYDDGTTLNQLMGTSTGQTGTMDVGYTDFGQPFYFEYIDRWRSFTAMYYMSQRLDAVSVYHENAAGANIMYQHEKAGPNEWKQLGAIDSDPQSLIPNGNSEDFNVLRLRIVGTTNGVPIVIHGIEIPQITQKGQGKN
jgi:hypothetical protein